MQKQNLSAFFSKNYRHITHAIGAILAVLLFLLPLIQAAPARALPAGFQEYYVLGNEEQIYKMFDEIDSMGLITSSLMRSVVTVVATADNQVFYYDHWEDGYEIDIFNPAQATTEIYGDGNTANGGSGSDILQLGDIVSLKSDEYPDDLIPDINEVVPVNTRNAADIRYDGSDYIVSTGGPIDLAHAMWPEDGTWIGGAWEVYSKQAWKNSYSYRIPVGVDMGGDFTFGWLQVGALYDNTNITIDNGTDSITIQLDQGQTYSSQGKIDSLDAAGIAINKGTTLSSDKQIQVGLVTGSTGTFQTRFFVMIPDMLWGTDYTVAVPRTTDYNEAQIYLFNPNNEAITVDAYDSSQNRTLTIPANDAIPYATNYDEYIPINSGARLHSDDVFWGVVTADTESTSYDWGFSLIPNNFLMDNYYVSWAPDNVLGVAAGTTASPVWVSPVDDDTTFYVDYGPNDGIIDETFTANALETHQIADPDYDNTGMHIWATNKFVPIWGPNPASGQSGDGYLDLGYTILPLNQGWLDPVLTLDKTANPEVLPPGGGTSTFNLTVHTHSPGPVTNINITDTLPGGWTYVPNSTLVTYPDSSTAAPEPAQNGQALSWNLAQSMESNQTLNVEFQAQLQITEPRSDDFESGGYAGGSGTWLGDWTESEGDGPNSGDIRLVDDGDVPPYSEDYQLQIADDDQTINRQLDLSDFTRPTLRFQRYFRSLENNEVFDVGISTNGTGYTSLLTWNSPAEDTWEQEEIDLSAYITDTVYLRFRGVSGVGGADYLHIDDVEIYDNATIHENHALAIGEYNGHKFNATDQANVYVSALNLNKIVDQATAAIGDMLVYTLTYQNSGAITTTDTFVSDLVPVGTTFAAASSGGTYNSATNTVRWELNDVAPSAGGSITFSVTINNETANGSQVENFARINSNETSLANSNRVQTTVQAPDLSLTKTGPTVAAPGDTITYTLTYANNGDGSATGVIISDTLPVSTTYVAGSLAINTGSGWLSLSDAADNDAGHYLGSTLGIRPGQISGTLTAAETGQIRYAVQIDSIVAEGTTIDNTARMVNDRTPPETSNLFSTDISPLSISKSGSPATATPGQTLVFTGTYANNGSITLTNVALVDSIPANTQLISGTITAGSMDTVEFSTDHGTSWQSSYANPASVTDIRWSWAELPASQSGSVGFQVSVDDPLPANTTIQNQARITSTQTAASGWLYSDLVSIGTIDLTLSKVAGSAFVRAGDPITYTLTYGNRGSVAAGNATLSDTIPAHTAYLPGSISGPGADDSDPGHLIWDLGSIPANSGGLKAGFVVTVAQSTAPGTAIYNTASIFNDDDSAATQPVQVTVAQDGVTLSPNRTNDSHDQGQQLCYAHTIGNTGNLTNTMELSSTHSAWTAAVSFYRDYDADGAYDTGLDTALTDTNSNSRIDTGELAPNTQLNLLACFTIPTTGVDDGDSDTLTLEAATASGSPTYRSQVLDVTTVRIENFLDITAPAANLITNTTHLSYTGTTNANAAVVITNTTTGVVYPLTADGFGNFAATITTTLGSNSLTARSTNLDGDTAADTRTVWRVADPTDTTNTVTILRPLAGTITATTSISVTGTADPGSAITATVGSAGPFTTTADASGNFSLTVTLPDIGLNTIEVTATDPFGNEDTATRDVELTRDSTPDGTTVTITAPPAGYVTTAPTATVTGTGDPGAAISVMVAGGGPFTTTVDAGGAFTLTVNLPTAGSNTIEVTATDPYNNVGTASREVLRHPFINFSGSSFNVDEGQTAILTVTLSAASNVTTTVDYALDEGTATAGSDYTGNGGTLTFAPQTTVQTISIPITADGLDENSESFSVSLSSPVSATLGSTTTATLTLIDNDNAPTVNFSSDSQSVNEGAGVYTITVELDTASSLEVTVPFTISGTATEGAGDDFTVSSSPVTIPAGQTSAVITITLNDDSDHENDETIIVNLGAPTHAAAGSSDTFTLTLANDDFTLTRTPNGNGSIDVTPNQTTYAYGEIITLTATPDTGWDFTSWSGDAAGSTTPLTLTITGDTAVTANFSRAQYTITATIIGSGSILTHPIQSTYEYGDVVTLTAFADFGWTFTGWSDDLSGSNTSETLIVTGDQNVTATFTQDTYVLTVNTAGNGAVVSNPLQSTYTYGEVVTLTANADPGWEFIGWSGDLSGSDNPDSLTMSGHKTVTATFGLGDITNTLTITSPTPGQTLTTAPLTITGQTDPGSALTVTVSTGDSETGPASPTDGTFSLGNVDLVDGSNFITIESRDPNGNVVSETVTVTFIDLSLDHDGDGVITGDEDRDNDGDPTNDDTDGDGIADYQDIDDDGDGINTIDEDVNNDGDPTNDDTDQDGTPDYLDSDVDHDGDGVSTVDEDRNGDGDATNDDTDEDGMADYQDVDDDGDGINTVDEDVNGDGDPTNDDTDQDGTPDYLDPDVDHDGDGVPSVDEDLNDDGNATNDDTDGDSIPNYLDPDDDDDGIDTTDEDVDGDGDPTNDDTDGDGIPNYLDDDVDHDGDGVPTVDEDTNKDGDANNDDNDGDGVADYLDPDDDNDGIPTADEDTNGNGDFTDDDDDEDGIPNYLDPAVFSLGFSKTALDVNGDTLLTGDTIRYTVQVTNTHNVTANNVVITDTLPANIVVGSISTSQGSTGGDQEIVWEVGDVAPNGGAATMVITVTLNTGSANQNVINTATVSADNAATQSVEVCPNNKTPTGGICETQPQEDPESTSGGVFLPIIIRN